MIDFEERAQDLLKEGLTLSRSKGADAGFSHVAKALRQLAADVLNDQADRMAKWRVLEAEQQMLDWSVEDIRTRAKEIMAP